MIIILLINVYIVVIALQINDHRRTGSDFHSPMVAAHSTSDVTKVLIVIRRENRQLRVGGISVAPI